MNRAGSPAPKKAVPTVTEPILSDQVEARGRREHQIRALAKLNGHFTGGGTRGQIHWACGTGKTYVGRWLAEDQHAALTIVFLPSLSLIAQTLAEWQNAGPWPFSPMVVCSDSTAADSWRVDAGWWAEHGVEVTTNADPVTSFLTGRTEMPRVVFSTYHSAPVVANAMRRAGRRADLVVCDEAHHLAGHPDPRFRIVLDDAELPARHRLFATATPVLAKTASMSMANESLFGPVLDRLDFAEAIERGLLVDYQVLVLDATTGAEKLTDGTIVPAAVVAAARHGASRMISFHSRVISARQFAAVLDGLALPDDRPVRATAIAGADPSAQRNAALAELADPDYGGVTVVSNARCLAEGVDVPSVDAVVFADPKSDTDTIQAIGRALRPAAGKTRGLIVLPVVIPDGAIDDEALYSSRFAAVWGVLRALRNLDPRMAAELDRVRRLTGDDQKEPSGGGTGGAGKPRSLITFEVDGLDLSAFAPRIVDDRDGNQAIWHASLEMVRGWAKTHGHTAIPVSVKVGERWIGRWVQSQRKAYAADALSPERVHALHTVPGWSWTFEGAWWHADVAVVGEVARRWLDLEDPAVADTKLSHRPGKTGTTVGKWCAQQRRDYRDGLLAEWQVQACEAIPGWTWNAGVPERDLEMVDALAEYVDEHGDANVPHGQRWGTRPLGQFITAVRRRKVMGQLLLALEADIAIVTPSKFDPAGRLDWRPNETRWEVNLLALYQFRERTGGLDIPEHHVEEFRGWASNLYAWCTRQRHAYRHGEMPSWQSKALEEVPGWLWERPSKARISADIGARSHGSRAGYAAGCRCVPCTEANRAYEVERQARIAVGESATDLVDAAQARGHLRILEAQVRWRARPAMQEVTGFNKKTIDEVINGDRARIKSWVHEALMALTAERLRQHIADNPRPGDPLPAAPTLKLIMDMVQRGFPRAWISREIGGDGKALQIGKAGSGTVYRRGADAIKALHDRLGGRVAPPRRHRSMLPTLDEMIAAERQEAAA